MFGLVIANNIVLVLMSLLHFIIALAIYKVLACFISLVGGVEFCVLNRFVLISCLEPENCEC